MNDLNLNQWSASKSAEQNPFPVHWEERIARLVKSLLTAEKGECRCHWLDADKNRILAWPSSKDPDTLILKIDQQKFIGLTRSDKNDERYWRFKNVYETEIPVKSQAPSSPSEPRPETKPEEKVESPVNFPSVNEPQPEPRLEDSEPVKKFREKYGNSSSETQ